MKQTNIRIIAALNFVLLGLGLSGCMKATIQVRTSPPGALVTEMLGNAQGVSPVTFNYDFKNEDIKSDGCFHVNGFKARWPSGATISTSDILRLCPKSGLDFAIEIARPESYPGLDVDLANSYQSQQLQLQKDQYLQYQRDKFYDDAAKFGGTLGRVLRK